MIWEKLGIIYRPDIKKNKDRSKFGAMIPTPIHINNKEIRVFFSSLDKFGVARPGYVDLCKNDLRKVKKVSKLPILEIGEGGNFDDNGIVACSVLKRKSFFWLYYVGFEQLKKIRYRLLSGLAIGSKNNKIFKKISSTPILERSDKENFFRAGPFVMKKNNIFCMWYVSGDKWININNKQMPVYDIKYIESKDGINWPKKGKTIIKVDNSKDEFGFGRPYVIYDKNIQKYLLFYSIRKKSLNQYRLGLAESRDCKKWIRIDTKLNLTVSKKGFDSKAIMYAAPFFVNNQLHLFYNGNEFGKDGFALAKLISY
jgi:hypothetical protein